MKLHILTAAFALALLAGGAIDPSRAQGPYVPQQQYNPYRRPPISPYLNLARTGNPAINYYGLVRPQIQNQMALNQLQQQQLFNQQPFLGGGNYSYAYAGIQSGAGPTAPITGVPTGFLNHSGYFQTWRTGGGAGNGYGGGSQMVSAAGGLGTGAVAATGVPGGVFGTAGATHSTMPAPTAPRIGGGAAHPSAGGARPMPRPMNPEE